MNLANIQLDKQKKILIVIFCIFIVYVDTAYILKAQLAVLNSLDPKITRLESDLKNLNRDLENMRNSKTKPGIMVQKAVLKSTKILTEGQISGLLQNISNEANKLSIRIIQMHPSRETATAKPVAVSDKLAPVLINLDLFCDYHNLGRLINRLENFDVFIAVQEIKILPQLPEHLKEPDYLKQNVTLILKTYVVK